MTSVAQCRFALWHHPSQLLQGTIKWRETPKSKALVGVVPPTVLPGPVRVISADEYNVELQLSHEQVAQLHTWLAGLPDDVLTATACDTGVLQHQGSYVVINPDMSVSQSRLTSRRSRTRDWLYAVQADTQGKFTSGRCPHHDVLQTQLQCTEQTRRTPYCILTGAPRCTKRSLCLKVGSRTDHASGCAGAHTDSIVAEKALVTGPFTLSLTFGMLFAVRM